MKTKTTISFLFLAFFAATSSSCVKSISQNDSSVFESGESKTLTSRHFEVGSFTGVECSSVVDLKIRQGTVQSVDLVAPTRNIDKFVVSVKKGVLHIDNKPGAKINNPGHIEMSIVVPELDMVKTTGTGDIDFVGEFTTKDFTALSSGTGDIEAKRLKAVSLNLRSTGTGDISITAAPGLSSVVAMTTGTGDISITTVSGLSSIFAQTTGTGDISLAGSVAKAVYKSNGTGDIEAFRMKASNVDATASSTGDIECYASESFTGSATGTGDIEVKGNPARREASTKHIRFSK